MPAKLSKEKAVWRCASHRTSSVNRIEHDSFARGEQPNCLALQIAHNAVAAAKIIVRDGEIAGRELRVEADIFGSLIRDLSQLAFVRCAVTIVFVDAHTMQLALETGNPG